MWWWNLKFHFWKSYQIAHIYCLFFLMVVVCLAGWCMGMQTMLLIDLMGYYVGRIIHYYCEGVSHIYG